MYQLLSPSSLLFLAALVLITRVGQFILTTHRPRGFPPGPPTLLGLGNLHQLPRNKAFIRFAEWEGQYGSLLGLKVGPTNVVVLHRAEEVRELLRTRDPVYSGRPSLAVFRDYVLGEDYDHFPGFMTPEFRRIQHRACRHHLGPQGVAEAAPIGRAMAVQLLDALSRLGEDDVARSKFESCFFNWNLGSTLVVVCGQSADDFGTAWREKHHAVQQGMMKLAEPGGAIPPIDIFPLLAWVPRSLSKWKQLVVVIRQDLYDTYGAMYTHAKQRHERFGASHPEGTTTAKNRPGYESLMKKLFRDRDENQRLNAAKPSDIPLTVFPDSDIRLIGGGFLDAASHTTDDVHVPSPGLRIAPQHSEPCAGRDRLGSRFSWFQPLARAD